ncbi:hypothetical protein F7725_022743 [Dissostichus mawsoni]|uniref:Uncharacterized protein n=1 Tax=Dissostichus mawsoni TaxID=36200 RepID=A0A7J5Z2Y8_DISMA|nr:hypothetical protein F7725_022743 [Dissostichus mawsoni]
MMPDKLEQYLITEHSEYQDDHAPPLACCSMWIRRPNSRPDRPGTGVQWSGLLYASRSLTMEEMEAEVAGSGCGCGAVVLWSRLLLLLLLLLFPLIRPRNSGGDRDPPEHTVWLERWYILGLLCLSFTRSPSLCFFFFFFLSFFRRSSSSEIALGFSLDSVVKDKTFVNGEARKLLILKIFRAGVAGTAAAVERLALAGPKLHFAGLPQLCFPLCFSPAHTSPFSFLCFRPFSSTRTFWGRRSFSLLISPLYSLSTEQLYQFPLPPLLPPALPPPLTDAMRLTALCMCGTLLAFLSLSWTTADEGDLFWDQEFGPCSATLRPEGPCRQGRMRALSLPPLTLHLPKELRELEKIVKDLQNLKDNVDELRKMCADCTVSQTERECGSRRESEQEKLNEGINRHIDEKNRLNEKNRETQKVWNRQS